MIQTDGARALGDRRGPAAAQRRCSDLQVPTQSVWRVPELGVVIDREQDHAADDRGSEPPSRIQQDHGRRRTDDDHASHGTASDVDGVSRLNLESSVSLSFNGTAL